MDESPEAAFEELAAGGLRGPASRAWQRFDAAWPVLERRLATFLRALGVAESTREDCGQVTLLRVWKSRSAYRGNDAPALGAWIYRITQREASRMGAASSRAKSRTVDLLGPEEDGEPLDMLMDEAAERPLEKILQDEGHAALESCIQALDTRRRAIIEMLYSREGHTERSVAELLEVGKSTVHDLRRDALDRLALCLGGQGELA